MTFQDLQNEVADLLESGDQPLGGRVFTRIGKAINRRYRQLLSSVGLPDVVRTAVTATTTIGNRALTFTGLEKIFAIYNPTLTAGPSAVLQEVTFDEMRNSPLETDPARTYAIQVANATGVTVYLSSTPASAYDLTADGEAAASLLNADDVPAFAPDFHDVLVAGALADVLRARGNFAGADVYDAQYEKRASDLRYFLAKSAYRVIHQGKHPDSRFAVPLASA